MFELVGTRFRTGYSAYGPPPVAVIELQPAAACDPAAIGETLERLEGLGLVTRPASESGLPRGAATASCFATLVSKLLERGGHRSGETQIETRSDGSVIVNLPCEEPETTKRAAEVAAGLIFGHDGGAGTAEVESFLDFASARMPHPDTRHLIRVAREHGLPVMRLDQDPFETSVGERPFCSGLIQIGHGARRRVLAAAVPPLDRERLVRVASREQLVPHLLEHNVPLPAQDLRFANKNRATRAVQAARRLDGPVCVREIFRKPFAHARQCVSIFEPLTHDDQIIRAYQAASTESRRVWVEAFAAGDRVRCLIVGGALVAATRSVPPAIVGDGRRSVAALIAEAVRTAATPRRRHAWKTIEAGDPDVRARLAIGRLEAHTVPESGRRIALRGEGTAFNGGTLASVLEDLSAPIRALAERVADVCGLNELAAIDLAIVDPAGNASPPNCQVLDVIPDPDLQSHIECCPEARDRLPNRLVGTLFPPGREARIPTVAITGTNGKTTTSRMTASILRRAYRHVGLATTHGAFVNDELLIEDDVAGVPGAAMVLADDRTQAAVLETARGGLHLLGTSLETVDAAACLNIASDHVGVDGITSIEELAAIKSRVLELADGHVVVNADDPLCLAMLDRVQRAPSILVSRQPESRAVRNHLSAGGRAVLLVRQEGADESLTLAHGSVWEALLRTRDIPAVMDGLLAFNAQNAAFACALCWALGIDAELIREGLRQFSNSVQCNPGRCNFIEGYPFTLLTDFAQNAHGLAELYSVIARLPKAGRTRLVCLTIGSRHREHIDENAADLVRHFDDLIIGCSHYADNNPQYAGDNPRESMLAHFRQQLLEGGARDERIETHAEPETAIRRGLETANPGDLLVILGSPKVVLPALAQGVE